MSPIERLTAAEVAVSLAKNHITKGEWWADELIRPSAEFDSGVFNGRTRVALACSADAGLIVTLHRTLDAQIHILRGARRRLNADIEEKTLGAPGIHYRLELSLADAILGDDA